MIYQHMFFIIHILCLSLSPSSHRSVSMIDMRGEEEAVLQPHSQVRHELMHNQYNKMKEEDDHWQDVSVLDLCVLFFYFFLDWNYFFNTQYKCVWSAQSVFLFPLGQDFYQLYAMTAGWSTNSS